MESTTARRTFRYRLEPTGDQERTLAQFEVDRQTGEARPPGGLRETGRWLCQQLRTTEDWGYFGPTSTIWALHREACLGVGLGRALLLQLAHPWVAQAVVDHSAVRDRP